MANLIIIASTVIALGGLFFVRVRLAIFAAHNSLRHVDSAFVLLAVGLLIYGAWP